MPALGVVLLATADVHSALAHPSDFQTLTLDLMVGTHGLESIDGAVVESSGPGYEPFPSVELRRDVAERVLSALGLPSLDASIDAHNSERYHEVGFLISLPGRQSSQRVRVNVDTEPLQEITDDLGLARLKLSVCGIDADAFSALEITASQPGRQPLAASQERAACEVWDIEPRQPPVEIRVRSRALASTGLGAARLVMVSAGSFLLGFAAVAARRLIRLSRRAI